MKKISLVLAVLLLLLVCPLTSRAEEQKENKWLIGSYVDKFDRPTGKKYITTENYIEGTFSNSATTDSRLEVILVMDKEHIFFRLYEYGDNQVDNYYSKDKYYSLSILDSKDIEHEISCYFCSEGTDLIVEDKDEFCRALEYGGKTMFYIEEKDGMSKYKFTVNFEDDFEKMYAKVGGEFENNEAHTKYLEEEEAKKINAKCEVSIEKSEDWHIKCNITSEMPDGVVINLYLFKNYSYIEGAEATLKGGKITYEFEASFEDAKDGDKYEVDTKLLYENQSTKIKKKIGKSSNYFYYIDGVEKPSISAKELDLEYNIYTVCESKKSVNRTEAIGRGIQKLKGNDE